MNYYSCSFEGRRLFDCSEIEVAEFVSNATAARIHQLEIGQTLVDDDGDTWTRTA